MNGNSSELWFGWKEKRKNNETKKNKRKKKRMLVGIPNIELLIYWGMNFPNKKTVLYLYPVFRKIEHIGILKMLRKLLCYETIMLCYGFPIRNFGSPTESRENLV